jgi:hypothetical protein
MFYRKDAKAQRGGVDDYGSQELPTPIKLRKHINTRNGLNTHSSLCVFAPLR